MMILTLTLTILLGILLILYLYFKIKNPFWSHQPVMQYHHFHYKWMNPGVINTDFYHPKFMNYINIITLPWHNISIKHRQQFTDHIGKHFINHKNITYTPSLNKHIRPYFDNDMNAYVSYYQINKLMIGMITNRTLRIHLNGSNFAVSYIDFLCVHRGHRKRLIAPELIQTHEYYQRTLSTKKCMVSLFKKEGVLNNFIPLVTYTSHIISMKSLQNLFNPERNILPSSITIIKINKGNINQLYFLIEEICKQFDCFIIPPAGTLLELINKGSIHIYTLVQAEQIICVYFFRETGVYTNNSSRQNLECFSSLNNCKDISVFTQGFINILQKIMVDFKHLQLECLSHNITLMDYIKSRGCTPHYSIPCAYYLYNYIHKTISPLKTLLIN
jgi:hypothetical protein